MQVGKVVVFCFNCGTQSDTIPSPGPVKMQTGWRLVPYLRDPNNTKKFVPTDVPITKDHYAKVPVCPNFGTDGCAPEMKDEHRAQRKAECDAARREHTDLSRAVKIRHVKTDVNMYVHNID